MVDPLCWDWGQSLRVDCAIGSDCWCWGWITFELLMQLLLLLDFLFVHVLFILLDAHVFLFGSYLLELFLVLFDFSQFILGEFRQVLFCWTDEIIVDLDLPDSANIWVFGKFGLKIEKDWQKKLLLRIYHLLIETETLNFRKVNICLFGCDVISWKSNDWLILLVVKPVKYDRCLRRSNYHLLLNRLKFPVNSGLGLSLEFNSIFFKISHLNNIKKYHVMVWIRKSFSHSFLLILHAHRKFYKAG